MAAVRGVRWVVGLAGAVVWLLAPVVLIARADDLAGEEVLRGEAPTWVAVEASTEPTVTEVGLRLDWDQPGPAIAPAWTGLVQEVLVAPGDAIADGQPVAVVDGITRIAVTGRPIGRVLGPSDRGADVASLNTLLATLGRAHGDGDVFTRATAAGTKDLSRALGLPPTVGFDPAWVLHLPTAGAAAATVALIEGAPVPAAGTAVVTFAPTLSGATVIAARDDAPAAPEPGVPGDITADVTGEGSSPAVDAVLAAAPAVALDAAAELHVGEAVLPVTARRDAVAPDGLVALRAEVEERAPYVGAEASVAATPGELVVPSAAVVTDEGGACLRVGSPTDARMVAVEIVGGLESRTRVAVEPAALEPGEEVEVGTAAEQRRCG